MQIVDTFTQHISTFPTVYLLESRDHNPHPNTHQGQVLVQPKHLSSITVEPNYNQYTNHDFGINLLLAFVFQCLQWINKRVLLVTYFVSLCTLSFCQSSGETAAKNFPYIEYLVYSSFKLQMSDFSFRISASTFSISASFSFVFLDSASALKKCLLDLILVAEFFITFAEIPLIICHSPEENCRKLLLPILSPILLSLFLPPPPYYLNILIFK